MSQNKITVHILDREYQFAATDEEKSSLLSAAHYLDEVMKKIKGANSTLSPEKVSIMAALNISHEMMKFNETQGKIRGMKESLSTLMQHIKP